MGRSKQTTNGELRSAHEQGLRLIGTVALVATSCLGIATATASTAGAYGKVGSLDVWQIGLSQNCNNADFCGGELGGFWGWAQFNRDPVTGATDADAEFAGCGHLDLKDPWLH